MEQKKIYNILFCGIGGQGIITASEICAWAALYEGYNVKKSEIHGMSQRGGSVESHLRFGNNVFSPLIPEGQVDFLVSFFREEHERMKHFLKKDGKDLINRLVIGEKEIHDKKLINTYLLGVLSLELPIKEKNWIKAFNKVLKRFIEKNIEIFIKGRKELN